MSEKTRLCLPDHGRQLLGDLVLKEQDILVYCAGGEEVPTNRLVLACISPLLRGALLDVEEPSLLLPDVKGGELQSFLISLATSGNLSDHQEVISTLHVNLEGWQHQVGAAEGSGVKAEDVDQGSELYRTAVNLSLLSPLTWRNTTLELASAESSVPKSSFSHPTSLADFSRLSDLDSDAFNAWYNTDKGLKDRVEMYIGQTEKGYACRIANCVYINRKKVLMKYHVMKHLKINTFQPPTKTTSSYIQFVDHKEEKSSPAKSEKEEEENLAEQGDLIERLEVKISKEEEDEEDPVDPLPEPMDTDPSDIQDAEGEPTFILPTIAPKALPKPKLKKPPKSKKKPAKKKAVSPSPSQKKDRVDGMTEETRQRCDQFIVFAQNTREYKCVYPECQYSHRSKTWLKYHVMKHLDITEFLCEECGEAFPMQKLLRKHVVSVHGSDELRAAIEKWIVEDAANPSWFRCSFTECGFAAATKKGAGLHALSSHMEKSFICHLCGEGFVTERSLQNHANYHHNKVRNANKLHPCSYCSKQFRTISYLEAHENEHKGNRPYQCDACGKSFASNGMLRSHKFAHAPKIFKCDCCDQAFPRKNTLMVHLRAVHMHEKPYECDICGQKFPRSSSMTRHRRIHTGLPRYQCHYCEKTTTQRGDLNRHMAKSHGWQMKDPLQQQQQQQPPPQQLQPQPQTIQVIHTQIQGVI